MLKILLIISIVLSTPGEACEISHSEFYPTTLNSLQNITEKAALLQQYNRRFIGSTLADWYKSVFDLNCSIYDFKLHLNTCPESNDVEMNMISLYQNNLTSIVNKITEYFQK